MKYTLVFNSEAEEEYQEAYAWYETEKVGLGDRFENAVENQIQNILSNPKTYHYSRGKFREASVSTFPFTIVYKENSKKGIIYISAVHHTSRHAKFKYRKFE